MDIYIDDTFHDFIYDIFNSGNLSSIDSIVYDVLLNYPETKWYFETNIDIQNHIDLEKLRKYPLLFNKTGNIFLPITITSIEEEIFNTRKIYNQIMVFTFEEKPWFEKAENLGVLCFSSKNYKQKIQMIIENNHYKIDLSEKDFSWIFLEKLKTMPFNEIVVSDNYILTNKSGQLVENNIYKIISYFLKGNSAKLSVKIFTKDFGLPRNSSDQQIKNSVQLSLNKLNEKFTFRNPRFSIYNLEHAGSFDFHDRIIMHNFFMIECGKGFNLNPHKSSNSQINALTIFDLYTYKRMKNLKREYYKLTNKLEDNVSFSTVKFKYIKS
jgi:hypothetical protein